MYILKKTILCFDILLYIHTYIFTHTHTWFVWMYAYTLYPYDYTHTHTAVQQYSILTGGQVSVATPAVWQCDSDGRQTWWQRGLKQHVVSFLLRGNLCSLFKVPTPLRWKILRFPNVTQCAVQLTTHVCWPLNTHTLTHIPNIVV